MRDVVIIRAEGMLCGIFPRESEDMITVLFVKAACVSLWRVPNLQAPSARSFKLLMGKQ